MFLTPLVLGTAEPGFWIVWQDAVWEDAVYGRLTLPCGMRTNLASTPQVLRASFEFDPTNGSRRAAAFHDGSYLRLWPWDRDKADRFLHDALLAEGASEDMATTYYESVRIFGQRAWDAHNGGMKQSDFDTLEHFNEWRASLSPTFTTQLPGVM